MKLLQHGSSPPPPSCRRTCRWRRLRLASTRQWHAVCTISASSSARRSKRGKHSHDERRKATSVEEAIDQLARRRQPAGLLPRDVPRDGNCFFHTNVPTSLRTRSFGRVEAARLLKSKSRQADDAAVCSFLSVRRISDATLCAHLTLQRPTLHRTMSYRYLHARVLLCLRLCTHGL